MILFLFSFSFFRPPTVLNHEKRLASASHRDLNRAPDVLYGVKYIDLVSLASCPFQATDELCNIEAAPVVYGAFAPPPSYA